MKKRMLAPLTGLVFAGTTLAQFAGETVSLQAPSDNDVYAAGRTVELSAPVGGDAVLAGQSVVVDGTVAQDAIVAGETVSVRAAVGDDVRAAARDLSLQADIGGHLAAAAQDVALDAAVNVTDWAWLAGQHLAVHGNIGGELRAAGETIRITGRVGGDADLYGGSVRIGSGAVIDGTLTVYSDQEPVIDEGARIAGQVVHLPSPAELDDEDGWDMPGRFFVGIAVLLALLAFYWLFPQFTRRVAATSSTQPLMSFGLGIGTLVATPLVTVVLLATGIGFLLALPLAAVYLVLLLLGYLAGLYLLADLVTSRFERELSRVARSLVLALIVVAVALLTLIPVLGPLAVFVLWLIGTGALVAELYRLYMTPPQQASRVSS